MNINRFSPTYKLFRNSKGIDFYVKRDDLIPDYFGGNKVRKNSYIINSMNVLPDVIITNGGSESNHARVCALMASRLGMQCHLVLHGNKPCSDFYNGNDFLISSAEANVSYVEPSEISKEINKQRDYYQSLGKSVEVIPGGAHSLEGAEAYMYAIDELDFEPDYIFFASGTGATQAGIVAGVKRRGWDTKVIGISVARDTQRGSKAIYEIYNPLCKKHFIPYDFSDIELLDGYRFGGYSNYNNALVQFIRDAIKNFAIPLDPVYTGKAFLGMISEADKREIEENSKVLFWHTGGLLNLQASKGVSDD
ncbi:TPA: 1-aminocyclopropane-1-carboxylate deaminase/D-cysteine desulfhydrase [Vibrio diabolicus]